MNCPSCEPDMCRYNPLRPCDDADDCTPELHAACDVRTNERRDQRVLDRDDTEPEVRA